MRLRLGTRASGLARAQSGLVLDRLMDIAAQRGLDLDVAVVPVTAEGDSRHQRTIARESGVFVAALRVALLSGECDLVIHALEDVPLGGHPDLVLASVTQRGEPRDALCSGGFLLADLPLESRIATDSLRRSAQILALRGDFVLVEASGSIDFQFEKLNGGDFEGLVLSRSDLDALGRSHSAVEVFDLDHVLPAAGQGAFAVEVLATASDALKDIAALLDDPLTRAATVAERAAVEALGGEPSAAVAAHASATEASLSLHVRVLNRAGTLVLNDFSEATPADAEEMGKNAALTLLGRGAGMLLKS
jgi:hydroxymethylbilane synthase